MPADGERARAFLRASYLAREEEVDEHPWGLALRTPRLPNVWDANLMLVDRWDGTPAELHAELERVHAAAGHRHRKAVLLDGHLAARLWPALAEPDWPLRNRYVLMAHRREPDRPADPAVEVVELDPETYAAVHAAGIRLEPWGADEAVVQQLLEFDRRIARALRTTYLGALVDGVPVAHATLYEHDGVAQVEDVLTLPARRGRGLARALVLEAVGRAREHGAELTFLVADDADWPKELYARLGFVRVGAEHAAGKPG